MYERNSSSFDSQPSCGLKPCSGARTSRHPGTRRATRSATPSRPIAAHHPDEPGHAVIGNRVLNAPGPAGGAAGGSTIGAGCSHSAQASRPSVHAPSRPSHSSGQGERARAPWATAPTRRRRSARARFHHAACRSIRSSSVAPDSRRIRSPSPAPPATVRCCFCGASPCRVGCIFTCAGITPCAAIAGPFGTGSTANCPGSAGAHSPCGSPSNSASA